MVGFRWSWDDVPQRQLRQEAFLKCDRGSLSVVALIKKKSIDYAGDENTSG